MLSVCELLLLFLTKNGKTTTKKDNRYWKLAEEMKARAVANAAHPGGAGNDSPGSTDAPLMQNVPLVQNEEKKSQTGENKKQAKEKKKGKDDMGDGGSGGDFVDLSQSQSPKNARGPGASKDPGINLRLLLTTKLVLQQLHE